MKSAIGERLAGSSARCQLEMNASAFTAIARSELQIGFDLERIGFAVIAQIHAFGQIELRLAILVVAQQAAPNIREHHPEWTPIDRAMRIKA